MYAGLTNGMGVTTFMPLQGVPETYLIARSVGGNTATRSAANGSLTVDYDGFSTAIATAGVVKAVGDWPPTLYYSGSAYVETSTGLAVVGRGNEALSAAWRVGNGLVRITPQSSTLLFEWWNGSSWVGSQSFSVKNFDVLTHTFRTVFVLRNSSEECVLRVGGVDSNGNLVSFDVSIRRGDRLVRLIFTSATGASDTIFGFASTTACTSTTWGLRTTSTISSRYVVLTSNYGSTKSTANGTLKGSAASGSSILFCVGVSGTNSTSGDPEGSDSISKQAYGIYGETQRVVF